MSSFLLQTHLYLSVYFSRLENELTEGTELLYFNMWYFMCLLLFYPCSEENLSAFDILSINL